MVCHFQSNLYKKITHYSIVQDSIEGNHTFINMSFLNTSNNTDDIFHLYMNTRLFLFCLLVKQSHINMENKNLVYYCIFFLIVILSHMCICSTCLQLFYISFLIVQRCVVSLRLNWAVVMRRGPTQHIL
jgi:hypothetical protein